MSAALQTLTFDRLTDQSERADFLSVGAGSGRVFAAANQGEARAPATFLTPYRVGREWRISPGFVEGVFISGSGDRLGDLTPGTTYYVGVRLRREVKLWFTPEPTEEDPTPEPVRYLSGRYTVELAQLVALPEGSLPTRPDDTLDEVTAYKTLFVIGADGHPPEGVPFDLLTIDPSDLSLAF